MKKTFYEMESRAICYQLELKGEVFGSRIVCEHIVAKLKTEAQGDWSHRATAYGKRVRYLFGDPADIVLIQDTMEKAAVFAKMEVK